jgi:hypothetical protein
VEIGRENQAHPDFSKRVTKLKKTLGGATPRVKKLVNNDLTNFLFNVVSAPKLRNRFQSELVFSIYLNKIFYLFL